MIILTFLLMLLLLLVSAMLSGNIGYFINVDSIVIVILGVFIYLIGSGAWKAFAQGIKLSVLPKTLTKLSETEKKAINRLFKQLMVVAIVTGLLSAAQGIFSGVFSGAVDVTDSNEVFQMFCIANFTTVYGVLISFFYFMPISSKVISDV
jgi:flagellar motor component MotA